MQHYVGAEAHRRTRSASRSRFQLVKWRAHELSNSPSPGWSVERLYVRGSAAAKHTRVSQAEGKQTQEQQRPAVTLRSITFKANLHTCQVLQIKFLNEQYLYFDTY